MPDRELQHSGEGDPAQVRQIKMSAADDFG
jgi:hypothetical protein